WSEWSEGRSKLLPPREQTTEELAQLLYEQIPPLPPTPSGAAPVRHTGCQPSETCLPNTLICQISSSPRLPVRGIAAGGLGPGPLVANLSQGPYSAYSTLGTSLDVADFHVASWRTSDVLGFANGISNRRWAHLLSHFLSCPPLLFRRFPVR